MLPFADAWSARSGAGSHAGSDGVRWEGTEMRELAGVVNGSTAARSDVGSLRGK